MSRRIIDERDALRRTVARQDSRLAELKRAHDKALVAAKYWQQRAETAEAALDMERRHEEEAS